MPASRTRRGRILRERNEGGFALFLQNLRSVVSLFNSIEQQPLETDILTEARNRLLDANGTITLLLNDISRGGPNPTGLPSVDLEMPLQNLKRSLTELINLLCSLIERNSDVDLDDEIDLSYSAPLEGTSERRGSKRYEI